MLGSYSCHNPRQTPLASRGQAAGSHPAAGRTCPVRTQTRATTSKRRENAKLTAAPPRGGGCARCDAGLSAWLRALGVTVRSVLRGPRCRAACARSGSEAPLGVTRSSLPHHTERGLAATPSARSPPQDVGGAQNTRRAPGARAHTHLRLHGPRHPAVPVKRPMVPCAAKRAVGEPSAGSRAPRTAFWMGASQVCCRARAAALASKDLSATERMSEGTTRVPGAGCCAQLGPVCSGVESACGRD